MISCSIYINMKIMEIEFDSRLEQLVYSPSSESLFGVFWRKTKEDTTAKNKGPNC